MKYNKHYLLWAALAILYAVLTIIIPPRTSVLIKYNISPTQARLIGLTVVIPAIAIWFAAFYGYIHSRRYAHIIKSNKDGKAMEVLSRGLMYLAIGLPISALANTVLTYYGTRSPHLLPTTTILTNYVTLILLLIAFWTINKGTRLFVQTIKNPGITPMQVIVLIAFILFGVFYVYVTLTNPARQFSTATSERAAYYLSDFFLVTTIIIPYLTVWYLGFSSTYRLYLYKQTVKGIIYKNALNRLAWGIAWVIISSILLRFLVSLTTLINTLRLKYLLIVVYFLLISISIGYIVIASGAKKLKKIEEV